MAVRQAVKSARDGVILDWMPLADTHGGDIQLLGEYLD